jgi:hypothetical protein
MKSHHWKLVTSDSDPRMVCRYQAKSTGSDLIIEPIRVDKEGEQVSRNSNIPPTHPTGGHLPDRTSALLTAFRTPFPGSPLLPPAKQWEEAAQNIKKEKLQSEVYKHSREQHVFPPDHAALDSASAELTYGGNINIAVNDVNGQKFDQSRQGLSLSRKEIGQPSPELTNGLKESSTKTLASLPLNLRKGFSSIYDSVLLVDNITIAKEVVGMLTNKYRHLVHACDTEVLFY